MPLHLFLEAVDVPLLGVGILGDMPRDQLFQHLMAHAAHGLGDVVLGHDLDALLEDRLALIVHDVVVAQHVFAAIEVARLDLLLRLFQRLVDPAMLDRLVLFQAKPLQDAVHAVGAEDAHQIVFEGQIEFRIAGITLTA